MARLLVREQRFIAEYLLDLDEGRAALAAGYATVADAKRLLRKRAVAEQIRQERARRDERLRVDGERLLHEWSCIAFSNARDYFPGKGETVDLQRLDVDRTAAVAEFQIDEQEDPHTGQIYRRTRVKLYDKLRALSDLARATGLLREETTLTIEHRVKGMSPQEREQLADELLERGRQYLPEYEAAVARGEVIEAAAGEDEEEAAQASPPGK